MSAKRPRRTRPEQTERATQLQKFVDDGLTLKEIGQHFGVSGERVRQLIIQLGIKGANRKRGRRPKPVTQTAHEIDLAQLKDLYYGDPASGRAGMPLAPLAKRFSISTNRLRKLIKHMKWSKRSPLPRPKRKAPRVYDIDEIRRLCVEERWSDQRIAEHYRKKGVKAYASYINLLRKKHDIKRDPLKASERKNAKADIAVQLETHLKAGKTPKEIAHLIPCSPSYVYRLATRHGLSHLLPRNRRGDDRAA